MLEVLLCAYVSLVVSLAWEARKYDDLGKIIREGLRAFALLAAALVGLVVVLHILTVI